MANTKIEWTDYTWNPVWGCKANCEYCYARSISNRFAAPMAEANASMQDVWQMDHNLRFFIPTFLPAQYQKKLPKKSKRIFVGSMSDIAFWKMDWIYKLAEKIREYPQHTFQLLTKFPKIYKLIEDIMPENVWFGTTITTENEINKLYAFVDFTNENRVLFISFEPLLSNIHIEKYGLFFMDWFIIGTMSGRKRNPTDVKWVKNITDYALKNKIPVFVKQLEINNRVEKDISKFPDDLQLRQFPKLKHS